MIHVLNRRADTHTAFCEDAYFHVQKDEWLICAVFDGCSGGLRSHFASQLHAYCMREVVNFNWRRWYEYMQGTVDASAVAASLFANVGNRLNSIGHTLGLYVAEMESTMVVALYNTKTRQLVLRFAGDGVVKINDDVLRETSGPSNAPNYLCHSFYPALLPSSAINVPGYVIENVTSFSICTDGIDQIRHPHQSVEETVHYLLTNRDLYPSAKMLDRKINMLSKQGAVLHDDVTIIRYSNETL